MVKQVNIAEAKAQLSDLVEQAEKGRSTIIARNGRPVAKLVPLTEKRPKIKPGFARDLLTDEQVEELTKPWAQEELDLMKNGPMHLLTADAHLARYSDNVIEV
jgi:prevent-host-death family protein